MSYFLAGAAAMTAATAYIGGQNSKAAAIKAGNTASKAEGEAIVRERLNQTIRNSYSTGLAQMQLGLERKRASQQIADVSAAELAAKGNANTLAAATGSMGASVKAIAADIDQKANSAVDMTKDSFEMAMVNYNNNLDAMVLNTDQSAPQVRENKYTGPDSGQILSSALLAGGSQFASGYTMKQMQLGLGKTTVPNPTSSSLSLGVSESQISSAWGYSPKF